MVLEGKVNKSLVSLINDCGGKAIGISGRDGNLLISEQVLKLIINLKVILKERWMRILDILGK